MKTKINIDLGPPVYAILLSPIAHEYHGWIGVMAIWGVVGLITHFKGKP